MAITPFTKQQLLPQEEKLEVTRHKCELFIGVPKETSFQERRICLTPDAVNSLTYQGHRVMIEAGAGESSSYSDKEYAHAGAEITNDTEKVFGCPIILKVEPASTAEIEMINPGRLLISAIQLKTRKKSYFTALAKKKNNGLGIRVHQGRRRFVSRGEIPERNCGNRLDIDCRRIDDKRSNSGKDCCSATLPASLLLMSSFWARELLANLPQKQRWAWVPTSRFSIIRLPN